MDALIFSCGTGGGHNSAGKAIQEELVRRGHHVTMMNPYALQSDGLAGRIDNLYIRTVQKAPRAFGAIYCAGELYRKLPFRSPVYHVNGGMISAMQEYLEKNHFDIVIMPHLFPAEILTNMKHRGMAVPKTVFVATDYCCIPFTEETDCDAYVIPAADLKEEYRAKGIPEERLYPFGIPVSSCFGKKRNRNLAQLSVEENIATREQVALSGEPSPEGQMAVEGKIPVDGQILVDGQIPAEWENRFEGYLNTEKDTNVQAGEVCPEAAAGSWPDRKYILISGGSMGAGKIEELVRLLLSRQSAIEGCGGERDAGIIVICGNNKELFQRLKKRYGRQVIVIGQTNRMADYLRACDLYITKPGGLSSTEAAVCGVPLMHMPPIPGCETHNAAYFRERNMSISCEVTEKGAEAILSLLGNKEICAAMAECQSKYISKEAASRICGLAERLAWEPEERQEPVFRLRLGAGA